MARRSRDDARVWDGMGSTPVPDPTTLTRRAVDAASEEWRRELEAVEQNLKTRLSAMDEATKLRVVQMEHQLAAQRELVLSAIGRLDDVTREKFAAVEARFVAEEKANRDKAEAARVSLAAALAAQQDAVAAQQEANKEAIEKSERAQAEYNRASELLHRTSFAAIEDKIDDLRTSRDSGVGTARGVVQTRTDSRAVLAAALGVAGLLLGVLVFIVSVTVGK